MIKEEDRSKNILREKLWETIKAHCLEWDMNPLEIHYVLEKLDTSIIDHAIEHIAADPNSPKYNPKEVNKVQKALDNLIEEKNHNHRNSKGVE